MLLTLVLSLLGGCDQLGIESASAVAAKRDAEGKAIGGACRYSARPIEQCFAMNKRADKAAIFAGWREMNDYMRDNKIEAMPAGADAAVADAAAASDADTGQPAADAPASSANPDPAVKSPDEAASKGTRRKIAAKAGPNVH